MSAVPVSQAMQQALAAYQRGDLAQADAICRAVLEARADHFDALHLRGVVVAQLGRRDEAVALLTRAVAADASHADAHAHLGVVLASAGRHAEALACFDRALAIDPRHALSHYNRGNALRDLDRDDEAIASYGAALALAPGLPAALRNRGDVELRRGRAGEALADYDRALAAAPGDAPLFINRGVALEKLGRDTDALASFERAIALDDASADAHFNRANALRAQNRDEEALASYALAIARRPAFAEAHHNRGVSLSRLARDEEAVAEFDRALALRPGYADAHTNRGNALGALKRDLEALESYSRALAIDPSADFLYGTWLHAKMRVCDWRDVDHAFRELDARIADGARASPPFPVLAVPASAARQADAARAWAHARFPAQPVPAFTAPAHADGRIRIGYFSANFHEHAMGRLLVELFERHDRSRFELCAFSFGPDTGDALRSRIRAAFDRFVDVRGRSDRDVAALARSWGIDVAVDLMGYTQDGRPGIFAHRAAPVQASYLGYPGTSGAPYIDYLVADRVLVTAEQRAHVTESVVFLPGSYQVNDTRRAVDAPASDRRSSGLPEDAFVFCCFNNNYKITPGTLDAWAAILREVQGSVLWLLQDNPWAAANLRTEASRRGIDPGRLVFAPRVTPQAHLARHALANLFLDTLPYNAHTTASDALWAGLPVLTCLGDTFAGRVAGSLLHAVGLPELVHEDIEGYVAHAVELARSPGKLAALADKLASARASAPLFDTPRFARHIEAAYLAMVERHRAGSAPADLHV